jgi:hypothetical protein
VYVCVAVAGASFLVASSGFSLAHSTPGAWLSISLPFVIGTIAAAVFILRPELRYGIAACAGMLILAEGLSQLSVFLHGYVISTLGTPVARGAVAVAVLGGLVASVIALVSLFSNRTWRPAPVHVKTTPKLAIPRGRRR